MDPTTLSQGLTITFWGLLLTFGTLGLMVLPIYLVNKYQEAHSPKEDTPVDTPSPEEPVPCEPEETKTSEAAVAAAIAVSILAARREAGSPSQLGSALEIGPGRWWTPLHPTQNEVGRTRSNN